jgi:ubiquinone/menaquinone biosynthesis C-methylase UbiE
MLQVLPFFEPRKHETILSVGTGGCLWEVLMASQWPKSHWYLVEENKRLVSKTILDDTIQYWEQKGFSTGNIFEIIADSFLNIQIQSNSINKLFFLNSLHELEQQNLVLNKVFSLLKHNGLLIIEESLASYPGQLHEGCQRPLFMLEDLKAICLQVNLQYLGSNGQYHKFCKLNF